MTGAALTLGFYLPANASEAEVIKIDDRREFGY